MRNRVIGIYIPLVILALALAALSGCAGMSTEARVSETAFQVLNVVDAGQTVTIGRNPGTWAESEGALFGRHPSSTGRVYAVMAAGGILHFAVTRLLDETDPGHGAWHAISLAWQGVTLGGKAYAVVDNFHAGIKPWGGTKAVYEYCGPNRRLSIECDGRTE